VSPSSTPAGRGASGSVRNRPPAVPLRGACGDGARQQPPVWRVRDARAATPRAASLRHCRCRFWQPCEPRLRAVVPVHRHPTAPGRLIINLPSCQALTTSTRPRPEPAFRTPEPATLRLAGAGRPAPFSPACRARPPLLRCWGRLAPSLLPASSLFFLMMSSRDMFRTSPMLARTPALLCRCRASGTGCQSAKRCAARTAGLPQLWQNYADRRVRESRLMITNSRRDRHF